MNSRRDFLKGSAATLAMAGLAGCGGASLSGKDSEKASAPAKKDYTGKKPNIIIIMNDDLGWGDVEYNGNQVIKTPELTKMAENGKKLNRYYSASPVCSPTRISTFTARNPYRDGTYYANVGRLNPVAFALPKVLKEQGYVNGHFGKWHLGTMSMDVHEGQRGGDPEAYSPPQINGFDTVFATESKVPTWDPMIMPASRDDMILNRWRPERAEPWAWDAIIDRAQAAPYGTNYWDENGNIVKENLDGCDCEIMVDRVVPFIEQAVKEDKPFFATVWWHAPHLPVVAGPEFKTMYDGVTDNEYHKNYYGVVTAMDKQVGRIRQTLRDLGAEENTIILFTSDHGPELPGDVGAGSAGPFRGRKRDLYEGGIRVPSVIEWPARIKPGTESDYPMVSSDVLPTILEVLGLDMPTDTPTDGHSMLSALESDASERPAPIGFLYPGKEAWTDNRYKIIRTIDRRINPDREWWPEINSEFELYDLLNDPGERYNIAEEHPEIVKRMSNEFKKWLTSVKHSDKGNDYTEQEIGAWWKSEHNPDRIV